MCQETTFHAARQTAILSASKQERHANGAPLLLRCMELGERKEMV